MDRGATRISAYCTHGVFPNKSYEKFSGPDNQFSNFWITDSCPQTVNNVKDRKPFKVLSLAARIAAALEI
jgi:phosphoribosylpyrophosphate synthetase